MAATILQTATMEAMRTQKPVDAEMLAKFAEWAQYTVRQVNGARKRRHAMQEKEGKS